MINKNKWLLVNNGENKTAVTFKQDINLKKEDKLKYPTAFKNNLCFDYNLIDIRRIGNKTDYVCLSVYFSGKKTLSFAFDNRTIALKYLFEKYPFLIEFEGDIKK